MTLKTHYPSPHDPRRSALQKTVTRRRQQVQVINHWLRDVAEGRTDKGLKTYCDEQGAPYYGLTKFLREPEMQQRIRETLGAIVLPARALVMGKLLTDLESEDGVSFKDKLALSEHLARLEGRAYEKQEPATVQINQQINLPGQVTEQKRVEYVEKAKEELEDLV